MLLKQLPVAGLARSVEGRSAAAIAVFSLLCLDALVGGFSVAMILPLMNAMLGTAPAPGPIATLYAAVEGLAHLMGAATSPAFLLVFFAVVLLVKALLSLLAQVGVTWFGQMLLRDWRERLFSAYVRRDITVAQSELRGHAVNIVTREAPQAHGYVLNVIGLGATGLAFLVQYIVMAVVNVRLVAAGTVIGIVLYVLLFRNLVNTSHRLGFRTLTKNKSMVESFVQTLSNLRDVQLLQIEERKVGELRSDNRALYRAEVQFGLVRAAPAIALEILFAVAIAAFGLVIAFHAGPNVNQLLAEAVFFIVGTYRLLVFASAMATDWVRSANRQSSFDALMDELKRFDAAPARGEGIEVASLDTDIEIRNLSYSTSQGQPVFATASASIRRGVVNALLGPSGSGKTTLLDLVSRLREPPAGAIFANGRDITAFSRRSWMGLFGYVSQEPTLFADTLHNNVALYRPGLGEEDVRRALEAAAATDVLSGRYDAHQVWIEENGANLSGGQRRRVAIARALVTRPDILILDEATQAIEISLEQELLRGLAGTGMTVLIVSHRVETADCADQILHLQDGRLSVAQTKAELEAPGTLQMRAVRE